MINRALKIIRESHSLSLTETAKRLGLSKAYVSEIENGKKTPSLDTVNQYANEFDIPVSSIMFFSEQLDDAPTSKSSRTRNFLSRKIIRLLETN